MRNEPNEPKQKQKFATNVMKIFAKYNARRGSEREKERGEEVGGSEEGQLLTNFNSSFSIFCSFVIKLRPCDQRKTKLNLAIGGQQKDGQEEGLEEGEEENYEE